ncbi:hypothetical protein SCHPADRAFT_915546 [Schizopora paradoxa]|uniref:Uncharacterized protein n=1 Tax=Schizopora paradoxa TaxID=27342 RepID=A0A0H2S737_9AGAM|nr:hypothetical protein SCHPADRAFT_915546 [Schizopora paradoxa]
MARDLRVAGDDGVVTLVEDELGAVHRLRLYNLPSQNQKPLNLDDILPPGCVLAIKEPYCEAASEDMSGIRVDHPSDWMYLSEVHALFPEIWKHQFDDPSVSPSESLKNEGNAFFKAHKYRQSVLKYTEALRFERSPSLGATLLLNRAQAYLLLGDYPLAVNDVQKYLTEIASNPDHAKSQDEKALFRGAKAFYALRKYQDAHDLLERLTKEFPQNKDARQELTKVKTRLEEEKWGRYDWFALSAEARKPVPKNDVADYVGSIKRDGSGVWVATRDVKAGELLLVSKALDVLFAAEVEGNEKALVYDATRALLGESEGWTLTRKIASKLSEVPSQVDDVQSLSGCLDVYQDSEEGSSEKVVMIDDRTIIDINVIDAVREAFATPFPAIHPLITGASSVFSGVGLWPASARPHLPHACTPNTSRSFLGDVLILRACRDLKSGEGLTVSHVHPALPLEERRAELVRPGTRLGACECAFCAIEEKEGNEMRARRVELVQRVKTLSDKAPAERLRTDAARDDSAGPSNDSVKEIARSVEGLCDTLESTYSQREHPAHVQPRFALLEPLSYLFACYLYLGPTHTEDAMRANARYFAALGFEFEYTDVGAGAGGGDVVVRRHGYYHPLIVKTLVQQSSVCWQLGKKRTADAWRRIAENSMEIVAGHRRLFKEAFGKVYASLNWEL